MIRPNTLWIGALLISVTTWAVWAVDMGGRADPTAPPVPAAAVPERTVRDFGAVGDGKTDDTAAFQKAVDARVGGVIVPRGVYRLSRPVVVDLDKVGCTSFAGDGTATLVMAGEGPAIRFVGTHAGTAAPRSVKPNVWRRQRSPCVDGLEIVGTHEKACGIEATGTMQLTVTRVTIRKALHAIHLAGRNRNVIVANCHLYENRGVGLYLDDVNLHQTNVTASHISYNAGGGIVVRAGNVRNIQISGCDIEGNMGDADAPATANVLIDGRGGVAGTAEVAIVGCTIQHTHTAKDSANVRFIGQDAAGRKWGHLTIADNVLSDVQINIDVQDARGVSITGNTTWKGVQHDLRVRNSTHVVVGANMFDRNPPYQDQKTADGGLLFSECADVTLSGVHVSGVRRKSGGIMLERCARVNVTGCSIVDCDGAGIWARDLTDSRIGSCLIRRGEAGAEDWAPIRAAGGKGNLLSGNLRQGRPVLPKGFVVPGK